ncbi:CopD family protein [Moraxella marmotae]|uniref:CopD family protein n=1 Tax=Moraxella marmotae TaxID=3344520 RepID=UPI0035D4E81E
MHKIALILHLLGASIWVGGHLYLLIRLMPNFVRTGDVAGFLQFEQRYEPLGMAALAVQVITGLYMMHDIVPMGQWGQPMGYLTALIHGKLTWLALTIITALHARFRVVSRLEQGTYTKNTLKIMAVHVALICLWSVLFVITGAMFR